MYTNPKNNIRKIIFLILANIILIFVVLLLFSWVLKWDIETFFSWVPLVNQPTKETIKEHTIDPLVIEKSDMDKRAEYLEAKEQQANLLQKELENKTAELMAFESELKTLRDALDKEMEQFEKQKNVFLTEEDRYRATANMLYNMDIDGAVELISNDRIHIYEAVKILLMLNKIAEELGKFSTTPVILQKMANSEDENRKAKAAQIIYWITKYDMTITN